MSESLVLFDSAFSPYAFNVRATLYEKGIEFQEVACYPPADAVYLAKNPTGRFPCLEFEDGSFLGETKAILNYLEGRELTVRGTNRTAGRGPDGRHQDGVVGSFLMVDERRDIRHTDRVGQEQD